MGGIVGGGGSEGVRGIGMGGGRGGRSLGGEIGICVCTRARARLSLCVHACVHSCMRAGVWEWGFETVL